MLALQGIPGWDLVHAVESLDHYVTVLGPALLLVLGVVCFCWGLGIIIKGWMGGQQSGPVPYGRAIALMIVGGACAWGNWSQFYSKISSGSTKTILQMGGSQGGEPAEINQRGNGN